MATDPQTRLFSILARDARVGVIFRRGPSRRVLLIRWNLKDDRFQIGQWLKGRIYERRCDLSPSGRKLIYFAANFKRPLRSWTAVSTTPYLTALALWQKGDCWGGGGLFRQEDAILLNHGEYEQKIEKGFSLPEKLRVLPFGERPGLGEDDPIYQTRLLREGWILLQPGDNPKPDWSAETVWAFKSPLIYEKVSRARASTLSLRMLVKGIHKRDDAWYVLDHEVRRDEKLLLALPRTDWADWDENGDLLYASGPKLFRMKRKGGGGLGPAKELADFGPLRFEAVKPPAAALRW